MAIIKTIQVHDSYGINSVSDYISNPEKTTMKPGDSIQSELDYETNSEKTNLDNELKYGMNAEKTTLRDSDKERILVDGYQCSPKTAAHDFAGPRRLYELSHVEQNYSSKQPVVAVHLIQSFPADATLDPRLVHQIGMELVEGLKDKGIGDFQAVVSTHMNTQHLHNHILINAFSIDGSKKLCDNWTVRNTIREMSDELCIKYGLPVLQEQDKYKRQSRENIGEHYSREAGNSWKEQMRQDIKACIEVSSSYDEWYDQMTDIGYTFRRRSDGTPISISDGMHSARLTKLGEEYTYAGIIEAIAKEQGIDVEILKQEAQKRKQEPIPYIEYFKRVSRYDDYGNKRSDLQIMILTVIQYLKKVIERLKQLAEQHASKELDEQIALTDKQISSLTKALSIMEKYGMEQLSDIGAKKKQVGHERYVAKQGTETLLDNIAALEKATANNEYPEYLYQVSPMSPAQRQRLFLLSKETGWHIRGKFDTITAGEAEEAINFMNSSEAQKRDLPQEEIPAVLRYGFTPAPATEETVADEFAVVRVAQKNYESRVEKLSSEYKDLVFVDKNCRSAKDRYEGLNEQRKEHDRNDHSQGQNRDSSIDR